ncbi:MAG TPA: hypothetical protein VLC92_22150 [Rhodocyclaceae bacterium]|nr:hypothetical protein [Rhodocyclaceae bacterium]
MKRGKKKLVIPAKAGIQYRACDLDPGFRRDDDGFTEIVKSFSASQS